MVEKIKVPLTEDFEEIGLCSWISFETLKNIFIESDKRYFKTNELSTEITGFIITKDGIQTQKKYKVKK